ncbi:MAG: hypothetical protein B6I20_06460 [Bacteroidetes bacterium 4572_117]|nr:MAG: hypothetical protein B6I20_06460 [Bacteroidetes bacterium 4572_117]
MGKLLEKLPLYQFERINRGTVVNMNYLKEINWRKKQCVLVAGDITEKFPVSSSFLRSL